MNQRPKQTLQTIQKKAWGQSTSIDLHKCDKKFLTSKEILADFIKKICDEIGMVRYGDPIIARFGDGDLEGYSAMQFIHTSTVVVHLDEFADRAFIDIFSCKEFNDKKAVDFCKNFFKAKEVKFNTLSRGD